jgi:hypothetical protein
VTLWCPCSNFASKVNNLPFETFNSLS